MSIQSEITRIESAKTAIGDAISQKGVPVPSGTKLDGMAPLILAIPEGEASSIIVESIDNGDGTQELKITDDGSGGGGSGGESMDDTIVTFNSLNTNVKNFVAAARTQYAGNDNTTIVANYRDGVTAYDAPTVHTITGLASGKIAFVDETNGRTFFDSCGTSYNVYGLMPNHVYRWFNITSSGTHASGRVKDTAEIRLISNQSTSSSKGLRNWRDIGGWRCDGGTMKFGMLFRGSRVHSDSGEKLFENEKDRLWNFDRIWSELEMRSANDMAGIDTFSHINPGIKYEWHPMSGAYTSYFGLNSSHIAEAKAIVEACMNNAVNGLPTYFHCAGGADRTGTLASILEGVCGVSQTDIDIDYELTSMTPWDGHTRVRYGTNSSVEPDKYGVYWLDWKNHIKSMTGSDNKYAAWCVHAGISIDLVNAFRRACIDGNPQNITVDGVGGGDVPDVPVDPTNILTLSVAENGSPYNGGLGYREGYRLDSSGLEDTSDLEGNCVTGFIPCSVGDTFTLEGIRIPSSTGVSWYTSSYFKIGVYDADKNVIYSQSSPSAINRSANNVTVDGEIIKKFTLNALSSSTAITGTAYMRLSFVKDGTPKITKS